ncbi:terpene synthase 10-like isoform X2 [Senna tora]|uniref:Terpene synthase 10-like isoform X2 n=1 Tax=Senna tora TaxID=362788 RepID=A0A834TPH1_9FABA|nr:terpene synthase 10-like isoform X2 [Senna tora]
MESFFWAMGMAYQPEFRHFRREMTKLVSILTIIDDIYDIYGTLEELQLFTQVVHRWDINAVDSLPEYMKICFLALYNFVNQIASHIMKETGYNIIPYLKKGREMKRGDDVAKSIKCYMSESGGCEEDAHKHVIEFWARFDDLGQAPSPI